MTTSVVCLVDDDLAVRKSLSMLIETLGVEVRTYGSAKAFLDDPDRCECDCLVLDVRMPGVSGLELQARLLDQGWLTPIIFITGHGDVPVAVQAMRAGAVDFLQKPFNDQVLLDRIHGAVEQGRMARATAQRRADIQARLALLSAREREVLHRVMDGKMNKVIAHELGISIKTVEDHRAKVMRKMGARSLAELVQAVRDGGA